MVYKMRGLGAVTKPTTQRVTSIISTIPQGYKEFPDFSPEVYSLLSLIYPKVTEENVFILQALYEYRPDPKVLIDILKSGKDPELSLLIYTEEIIKNKERLFSIAEIKGEAVGPQCKTCASKNTAIFSKQTRSLDEPETISFICYNCGSKRN